MSAAIPMSIYLIVNSESFVQYLISHMEVKSIPPPIHLLCIPAITGTLHSIMLSKDFCIERIVS